MSARTKARKRALDVLFEADQRALPVAEVLAARIEHSGAEAPLPEYSIEIVRGFIECAQGVDRAIAGAATEWTLDRMPAVDRALLRVAAWEILYNPDVDPAVAIDEAVSLAATLSTDDSGAFVNGVLGTIARGAANGPTTEAGDRVQ